MSEVDYKQTCQTEIDQMSALVERYQNLDPVRVVELGDKVIKYCTPNLMTLDRVWNLFHAEPVTIQWILNFEKNEICSCKNSKPYKTNYWIIDENTKTHEYRK